MELIGIILVIVVSYWLIQFIKKIKEGIYKYNNADARIRELQSYTAQHKILLDDINKKQNQIEKDKEAIEIMAREKSQGFPWLAGAIADYFELMGNKLADSLRYKPHPAVRSAEIVKEEAKKRRLAEKQFRVAKYLLEYYESLFPWLVDFRGEDLDDLIRDCIIKPKLEEEPDDAVKKWVTKAEYEKLSVTKRNQLALDRYWLRKKRKWEIGRDYERYIGYLYESKGYNVYYQGIIEGLEDLGRDLIISKKGNNRITVIQCKNWSQEKTIHEKHICQFKGTVLKYCIENQSKKVIGKFITSTKLSDTARQFAKELDIVVLENFPFQNYPSIKCNVSRRTDEKIYHLPIDQQYDRTLVEEEHCERYVETVAEAEKLGFRRAFRWHGEEINE